MAIAITVKEYLDNQGVDYELIEHPYAVSSMRTADEAHVSGEKVAKAVVLHDKEGYLMAVVPATHKVQLGRLSQHCNRYLALADENDLPSLFDDCSMGAIPAVGEAYGMEVVMDDCLAEREDIYFEAGDHTDLVHVSGSDFMTLLGNAEHCQFSRHQ